MCVCVCMSFCFLCFIRNVFYGYFHSILVFGRRRRQRGRSTFCVRVPLSIQERYIPVQARCVYSPGFRIQRLAVYPDSTSWGKNTNPDPSIVCKLQIFSIFKQIFYQKMTGSGSETLTLSYLCTVQYNYIAQIWWLCTFIFACKETLIVTIDFLHYKWNIFVFFWFEASL